MGVGRWEGAGRLVGGRGWVGVGVGGWEGVGGRG